MKLLLPHFPILIKKNVRFLIHVIQMDPTASATNRWKSGRCWAQGALWRLGIQNQQWSYSRSRSLHVSFPCAWLCSHTAQVDSKKRVKFLMHPTIRSVQSSIIPVSCLLLWQYRTFQEHTLIVCQIFVSVRDRVKISSRTSGWTSKRMWVILQRWFQERWAELYLGWV